MTETRRTRPILATVISVWEVSIVVIALAGHVAIRLLHSPREAANYSTHSASTLSLHASLLLVGYALAIAGAITLWQMGRSAFIFLAARCVVELALLILASVSYAKTYDFLLPFLLFVIDVLALALSTAIAWYAYKVTKPKRRRHRRHRTHRSRRTSQSRSKSEAKPEPTQKTNPAPAPVAQDEPLTTSRFYLSPDHKETIRKD